MFMMRRYIQMSVSVLAHHFYVIHHQYRYFFLIYTVHSTYIYCGYYVALGYTLTHN